MKLWLHSKLLGCFHDWSGLRPSLPRNPSPALHTVQQPYNRTVQPYSRAAPCSRRLPRGPAPPRLPRSVSSPSNSSARLSPVPDFSLHPKPDFTYESRRQGDPPSRRSGISEIFKHDSAPTPVAKASQLRPLLIGPAPKCSAVPLLPTSAPVAKEIRFRRPVGRLRPSRSARVSDFRPYLVCPSAATVLHEAATPPPAARRPRPSTSPTPERACRACYA